jgi:hypothetical protein
MLQLLTIGPRECGPDRDAEPTKTLCGSVGNGETGGTAQFTLGRVMALPRRVRRGLVRLAPEGGRGA